MSNEQSECPKFRAVWPKYLTGHIWPAAVCCACLIYCMLLHFQSKYIGLSQPMFNFKNHAVNTCWNNVSQLGSQLLPDPWFCSWSLPRPKPLSIEDLEPGWRGWDRWSTTWSCRPPTLATNICWATLSNYSESRLLLVNIISHLLWSHFKLPIHHRLLKKNYWLLLSFS